MAVLQLVEGLGGSARSRRGIATQVVTAARANGWIPSVVSLDELDVHRADRVVLCGGDGLIHRSLPLLAGTGTEVAIVPVGSGNDFARSFAIGGDGAVNAAASAPGTAEVASVDLIDADGALAASVLTGGYSGRVNATANQLRFPPGSAKYTVAALREIGRLSPAVARLVLSDGDGVEQQVFEGPLTMFAIGNTSYFGGGMRICPDANPSDGLLDVVTVGEIGRLDFARWLPRVFKGTHCDHPTVTVGRAAQIVVETTEPLWADGEPLSLPSPSGSVTVRARAAALRLIQVSPPAT